MRFLVPQILFKELLFRPGSLILNVLAFTIAILAATAGHISTRNIDSKLQRSLHEYEQQISQGGNKLVEDYREIAKRLGYTVFLIPREQNKADYVANGLGTVLMPESVITNSLLRNISTLDHLTPLLRQEHTWSEYNRRVIISGFGKESHRSDDTSRVSPSIESGSVGLGYELHWGLGIRLGDKIKICGAPFIVSHCFPPSGSTQDIAVSMTLSDAQRLLGRKGEISEIAATEAITFDNGQIIKPDFSSLSSIVTPIELKGTLAAQRKSVLIAYESSAKSLELERLSAEKFLRQRRHMIEMVFKSISFTMLLGLLIITVLNIRERKEELALLSSLGMQPFGLVVLFWSRAMVIGVLAIFGSCFMLVLGANNGKAELLSAPLPSIALMAFAWGSIMIVPIMIGTALFVRKYAFTCAGNVLGKEIGG